MQANQQNSNGDRRLNLSLITTDYFAYETEPEQYLLKIILQNNPWPHHSSCKLRQFLQNISKLYNAVSYHNLTHAFDVMTSFDQYLIKYGWMQKLKVSAHKRILMLIAAYAHDSGHEGLTNAYYKNSKHPLSVGTVSPLQTMHAGNLKRLFLEFQLEISKQNLQELVEMILKTDNFYHGWLLDKIELLKTLKQEELQMAEHAHIMNCILLHAADLNNAAKDFELSIRWTNALYVEFQKQGELQERRNLAVSFTKASCELEYIDSNMLFLDHMIMPLFKGISQMESKCIQILERIIRNKQHWRALKQNELIKVNGKAQ